jgi:cytochrome c-type biogenesis protein CcmH/NrfF
VVRAVALTVLEVGFVLVGLAGVALWSVPAALVIGGTLGVVALERATRGAERPQDEKGEPR